MDRHRVRNEKLSELEQEQQMQHDSLKRKAMDQLQENEEEIKRLNQVRQRISALHLHDTRTITVTVTVRVSIRIKVRQGLK